MPNADVVALETAAIGALAQQNKVWVSAGAVLGQVWWLWLSEGPRTVLEEIVHKLVLPASAVFVILVSGS